VPRLTAEGKIQQAGEGGEGGGVGEGGRTRAYDSTFYTPRKKGWNGGDATATTLPTSSVHERRSISWNETRILRATEEGMEQEGRDGHNTAHLIRE